MSLQDTLLADRCHARRERSCSSVPAAVRAMPGNAVFVIDERFDLHSCNTTALALAREGLGGQERFSADDRLFLARLQDWLKRCRSISAPCEARWPVTLRGMRQVAVDAMRVPALGLVVLTVDDPEQAMRQKLALVAEACGLTPSEERMLALVVEGLDTVMAAGRLGIAPTTARTHLQRLFAKTGTARQSELVRFVATYVEDVR